MTRCASLDSSSSPIPIGSCTVRAVRLVKRIFHSDLSNNRRSKECRQEIPTDKITEKSTLKVKCSRTRECSLFICLFCGLVAPHPKSMSKGPFQPTGRWSFREYNQSFFALFEFKSTMKSKSQPGKVAHHHDFFFYPTYRSNGLEKKRRSMLIS